MRYYASGLPKIIIFFIVAFLVTITLPRFSPIIFPAMAAPSLTYDCDDGTLSMYRHFQRLGIEATPIVGNLELTGEEYKESNHVWLLVASGDNSIAYDWGQPRFDKQHYEGYTVSLEYLMYAVAEDMKDDNA